MYLANRLVGRIVGQFKIEDSEGLLGAGKTIGILERLLAITLVYQKQFTAIAFILTAKSIIRFERKEEKVQSGRKFAEYFLIGTLSSMFIAVFTGIIIVFLIDNVDISNLCKIIQNSLILCPVKE